MSINRSISISGVKLGSNANVEENLKGACKATTKVTGAENLHRSPERESYIKKIR